MTKSDANELVSSPLGEWVVGGVTYLLSQPSQEDLMTIRKWVKRRLKSPLASLDSATLEAMPPKIRQEIIREALAMNASGSEPSTEATLEILTTPEGCAFFGWILARKNHPGLTLETLSAVIDATNSETLFLKASEAVQLDESEGNSIGRPGS